MAIYEKKKLDLKISAAKKLEPEVISDKMIADYIKIYNQENKIYDQDNLPIVLTTHLALSFQSLTFLVLISGKMVRKNQSQ